ncbi:MAG: mechanosensitive ion channel family protein [Ferruginibacter sp.]
MMDSFWSITFLGNTTRDWLIAAGIVISIFTIAKIIRLVVIKKIQQVASKTESTLDDFVVSLIKVSGMPFIYILAIYLGSQYLTIPPKIDKIIHIALAFVCVFFIIRIINAIIAYSFQQFRGSGDSASPQVKQATGILLIVKIITWFIGIIFLMGNLGYDITAIIAGLGVGGIAIALAAQAVLADLFSYLVIFFDKPFEIGDFIVIGDKSGVVEYVGLKTTRLKTLSGEQLIASNTDLTSSRVQNFKRMEKRRIVSVIGVTYETSAEKLKKIPGIIQHIIESTENITFDRVHFSTFGDFSLNFEMVYYVSSSDYVTYMNSQQQINLNIFEAFENEGIEFAYPTQKIFVAGEAANIHSNGIERSQ